MEQLILIAHVIIAIAIVGLVLIQQGKGADIGAAFGGGSSGSLFGAAGATSFLVKLTAGLALLFFVTSLSLGHIAAKNANKNGGATLSDKISQVKTPEKQTSTAPATSDIPAIDKKAVDEN